MKIESHCVHRDRLNFLPVLVAAVIFFISPVGQASAQMLGTQLRVGDPAPPFSLKDINGQEYDLANYLGNKVICLDFWATWCVDCRKELPSLVTLYNKYRDRDFVFLGVTLDDNLERIKQISEENAVNYPVLLDENTRVASELYRLTGVIPLKFVIDRDGIIQYIKVGRDRSTPPEIIEIIENLLDQPVP